MSPAHTEPHPLTAAEVEASRQRYGENRLTKRPRIGFWRQFLGNFGDPIIKVLLAALAINLLFLFRHFDWYESAGIAVAIFLATFVSTLSEHGSEAAFARLQEDADRIFCRVRRAGQVAECPIGDIVVGDLVLLQSGERVPADGRLIEGAIQGGSVRPERGERRGGESGRAPRARTTICSPPPACFAAVSSAAARGYCTSSASETPPFTGAWPRRFRRGRGRAP